MIEWVQAALALVGVCLLFGVILFGFMGGEDVEDNKDREEKQ